MAPEADGFVVWLASALLLSLRVSPVFALAPPFTLVRLPAVFRMVFGFALAGLMATVHPLAELPQPNFMLVAAMRELMIGALIVALFQIAFGALYFVGRTIDIQAGFGLAALVDPTTKLMGRGRRTLMELRLTTGIGKSEINE